MQPRQVHLSRHPRYKLLRSKELFEQFGAIALAYLNMIKFGHSTGDFYLPSIGFSGVVFSWQGEVPLHHLTKSTIGPLLNKAIEYRRGLSPRVLERPRFLNGYETRAIASFLQTPGGDKGVGGFTSDSLSIIWCSYEMALH